MVFTALVSRTRVSSRDKTLNWVDLEAELDPSGSGMSGAGGTVGDKAPFTVVGDTFKRLSSEL